MDNTRRTSLDLIYFSTLVYQVRNAVVSILQRPGASGLASRSSLDWSCTSFEMKKRHSACDLGSPCRQSNRIMRGVIAESLPVGVDCKAPRIENVTKRIMLVVGTGNIAR